MNPSSPEIAGRHVLIAGATSAIAQATARRLAEQGHSLFLAGRDATRLADIANDLSVRSDKQVQYRAIDFNDSAEHAPLMAAARAAMGALDTLLVAYGTLPDQKACETSVELTLREFHTNAVSVIALVTAVADDFEKQAGGTIAVITSVAGDRGRQSNYVYGAAKGAVSIFLEGLRNRLHSKGVHVLTIKPGFVDTPMTAAFKKGLLWVSPDAVAAGIIRAIDKNSDVAYLPWFWRYIMLVIRHIPEAVFKRMSL